MLFNIIMEMIDFRSFDLNTKLLTTAPKFQRLIKGLFTRTALFIYAVICVSPYCIPSALRPHPAAFGLIKYFSQIAWFLWKEKSFTTSHKKSRPDSTFCKVLSAKSVMPLRLARGTKIPTLNQRAVRKDSPFHIRCDLCFPLLYPLPQKVSHRLNFLQSTFGKKCDFCQKEKYLCTYLCYCELSQYNGTGRFYQFFW